jgi:hypothetical protein
MPLVFIGKDNQESRPATVMVQTCLWDFARHEGLSMSGPLRDALENKMKECGIFSNELVSIGNRNLWMI